MRLVKLMRFDITQAAEIWKCFLIVFPKQTSPFLYFLPEEMPKNRGNDLTI